MSYSQDREAFVWRMARIHGSDLATLRALLRDAGILQRGAEVECSVNLPDDERAVHDEKMRRAEQRVIRSVDSLGLKVTLHGDPRGCVVQLYEKGQNVETTHGIGVPAQGYSARQIERMTEHADARREAGAR